MKPSLRRLTAIACLAAFCSAPARAAEDPTLLRDLSSTIALLGLPCGQVVSAVSQGSNNYIATCKDKNRYRVFLNPQGRVTAEKL